MVDGSIKKILIVEDDEFLRGNLGGLLSEQGFAVTLACDGDIGARLCALSAESASEDDYAIIICDYQMPKKNGLQVFESITKRQRRRFLLWTGALGGGFRDCIRRTSKDIDREQMLELVNQIISDTEGLDHEQQPRNKRT